MCTLTRFVETLKTKTIKHLVTDSLFPGSVLFPPNVIYSFIPIMLCFIYFFAVNMRTCAQMQLLPCFVSFTIATTCKLLNFLAHFLAQ